MVDFLILPSISSFLPPPVSKNKLPPITSTRVTTQGQQASRWKESAFLDDLVAQSFPGSYELGCLWEGEANLYLSNCF